MLPGMDGTPGNHAMTPVKHEALANGAEAYVTLSSRFRRIVVVPCDEGVVVVTALSVPPHPDQFARRRD